MHRQVGYILLILSLSLSSLGPTALAGVSPLPQVSPPGQPSPACALLDDSQSRTLMSAAFEWALLEKCGRLPAEPPPLVGEPGPAALPAAFPLLGPDVRVNAVDPPASSTIQSETSTAVHGDNGTVCATFNDTYHSGQGNGTNGFSRSTDGGQTWQDGGYFSPGPRGYARGDPSVAWRRADGHFYFTALLISTSGLGVWRSTDDCASFQWLSAAHLGTADDKEFMTIDNNPASPYYGRIYIVWTDFNTPRRILLTYSDNGVSWSDPVTLNTPGDRCQGAWPAVAPNGDVYVAWVHSDPPPSIIHNEVVRSTDGGVSFSYVRNPLTGAIRPRDADASDTCGRPALNGYIRYLPSPQIVVGPDGCLHVAYSYDPDGYDYGDVVNVYYRRSCDHGTTWGPEIQLNDDDTLTDQFFPAIAVNEDNIVAASWYDRRLDPNDNWLFNRYWTVSYDGGLTWQPNERVSDVSSPVYSSPGATGCYHGDYDQMAVDGDTFYIVWSDDRIWFNGHWDPDIWFDQTMIVPDFTLGMTPQEHDVCLGEVVSSTVTVGSVKGYNQPVTLSDSGLPAGVQTAFTVNPVDPLPGTSTYVITVTDSAAPGTHAWLVSGSSPTLTHDLTVTLVIGDCCEPVHGADFGWVPLTPTAGQVVTFTASASGTEPISYSWNFDFANFELGNPITHVYTVAGEYGVVLTATNDCGEEVVAHTVTVVPTCEPVTTTAFTWVPLTPTTGQVVTFTASASGTEPISYSWNFEFSNFELVNPITHVFTMAGEYRVTLTATNDCGEEVVAHTVTVIPTCEPVTATAFTWDPLTPTTGQVVTFTASASGTGPITYSWNFDFANFELGNPMTHVYTVAGEYAVTLTATNGCGVELVQHTLTVLPALPPEFNTYLSLVFKVYSP